MSHLPPTVMRYGTSAARDTKKNFRSITSTHPYAPYLAAAYTDAPLTATPRSAGSIKRFDSHTHTHTQKNTFKKVAANYTHIHAHVHTHMQALQSVAVAPALACQSAPVPFTLQACNAGSKYMQQVNLSNETNPTFRLERA